MYDLKALNIADRLKSYSRRLSITKANYLSILWHYVELYDEIYNLRTSSLYNTFYL